MLGVRFLSLMALTTIVAALFLARVTVGADLPSSDRAELPGDSGNDDDGSLGDDGCDLALPPGSTMTSIAFSTQPVIIEPAHAPATSAFAAPIFRPPISALA